MFLLNVLLSRVFGSLSIRLLFMSFFLMFPFPGLFFLLCCVVHFVIIGLFLVRTGFVFPFGAEKLLKGLPTLA